MSTDNETADIPEVPSDYKLDMINRDPNQLNGNLKVQFEDVIGEPEGAHSIDCVWRLAYKCFEGGRGICYKILTIICALPLALCWGCEFACITFSHIWYFTPCLRVFGIVIGCAQKFYGTMLQCFMAPCCETIALIFSKINVVHTQN